MIIEDKRPDAPGSELIPGRYLVSFERRRLDDIGRSRTRARTSGSSPWSRAPEINEGLYRTFVSP